MQTANERLLDSSIRHSINLDSLSKQEARILSKLLDAADTEIINKLINSNLTTISRQRLSKILNEIRSINIKAYKKLDKELTKTLTDITEYEVDFSAKALETNLPVGLSVTSVTIEQLKSIITTYPLNGQFIGDWVKDLSSAKQKKIDAAIKTGIIEGNTNSQIIRKIRGSSDLKYKDGITKKSKLEVEKLVRTSINHISSRARDMLYQSNQGIVKKWKFVATLDGRTSLICASLDGKAFDIDSGPMPPRHFNCRSTTAPILRSWKEMGLKLNDYTEGTRSTLDGQVPESLNYSDWLRKQDRDFIEEVLGKKKAGLFINNKLSLDKFINNSCKAYTLQDLKKKDGTMHN